MDAASVARELGNGNEKQQGGDWITLCPAHSDKNPSLSLKDGEGDTLLWHCRAGCGQGDVMRELKERGLLAGRETTPQTLKTLAINTLARSKNLPSNALRDYGLREYDNAVIIEYRDSDGNVIVEKRRTSSVAKSGSYWPKGQPLIPYGLDRLSNEPDKPLILPEGESDCWTLWHHGYRALGIPGAGAVKTLEASHLETVDSIFIIQETDEAGGRFVKGIRARLTELQYKGRAFPVRLSAKDPNELHKQDPAGFKTSFDNALYLAQIEHLAGLSIIEYEQIRKSEAKRLNVRPSVLDAEVRKIQAGTNQEQDNSALSFLVDPEPWPKPVKGNELLDALARIISKHVVLPAGAATAIALWVLFTYVHDSMRVSPLLCLTSPEKRCGKTTALSLLRFLVRRPLPASNITPAALFRSVEKWTPTLLIDEADTFVQDNDELRGVLNSGHTRETAFVIRTSGDDHEP
ncbi:MAG: hypothetical protein L3J03_09915, partial [Desulfobacterales bacterium]|nr:hypothetical protein [Desulfobacterales bacterium]